MCLLVCRCVCVCVCVSVCVFDRKFITPVPVNLESSNLVEVRETAWEHLWQVVGPDSVHRERGVRVRNFGPQIHNSCPRGPKAFIFGRSKGAGWEHLW